jgi:hypothetical protein
MTFYEVLDQVMALLQRQGRVSYRALKREFALDDDYVVSTNLFRPLFRGVAKEGGSSHAGPTYEGRRAEPAPLAFPPALVTRHGPPAECRRLRAGDPFATAVGRHLSLGCPGGCRGPKFRPALSDADGAWPGTGSNAGLVSLGITQARMALLR